MPADLRREGESLRGLAGAGEAVARLLVSRNQRGTNGSSRRPFLTRLASLESLKGSHRAWTVSGGRRATSRISGVFRCASVNPMAWRCVWCAKMEIRGRMSVKMLALVKRWASNSAGFAGRVTSPLTFFHLYPSPLRRLSNRDRPDGTEPKAKIKLVGAGLKTGL
jgi:hypothetical protein